MTPSLELDVLTLAGLASLAAAAVIYLHEITTVETQLQLFLSLGLGAVVVGQWARRRHTPAREAPNQ